VCVSDPFVGNFRLLWVQLICVIHVDDGHSDLNNPWNRDSKYGGFQACDVVDGAKVCPTSIFLDF